MKGGASNKIYDACEEKYHLAMISSQQIKAARALLEWTQPQLARASGVSVPTIIRMEGSLGPSRSVAGNVEAVRRALEDAGIIFQDSDEQGGVGVRLKR